VGNKLVEYKLILPKSKRIEMARQLGIPKDDIKLCYRCSDYYLKEDFVEVDDDGNDIGLPDWDKEKGFSFKYQCKNCVRGKVEVRPISEFNYDIEKALEYHLGMSKDDYFICENCKNRNFMLNKGRHFCSHCEIKSSRHLTTNYYYRNSITKNEIYIRYAIADKKKT